VTGTENIVDAMIATGVTKLIFSSSAAVYGIPETLPIDETHILKPINVYGETKLHAERAIASAAERGLIDAIIFRYFNAAGTEPSFRTPERHNPETHLIPNLLNNIRLGHNSATIYGSNYSTPDGTAIRDYVHVMDIADAHARALDFLSRNTGLHTLNLGTTTGFSVLEVVSAAEDTLGTTLTRRFGDPRLGDPPCLVATSRSAAETINWLPRRSSLRQIILDAWRAT
jgi:UDP-glucose 4-epimerase